MSPQRFQEQRQAYLAAIVESSDDAILSKDLDGVIQSCNAAAERLFGYRASELIGQPVRILIPPERQFEEDEILARIRSGERIEHFETVRLAKDGHPIEMSLTVSPVRDAAGRVVGASKIARDITDRKRNYAALARLAAIVESSDDAILSKDLDGTILSANAAAERMFEYRLEELIGRSVRMLIPAERHLEEDEILRRIRRGERIDHFETVRVAKSGRRIDISLTVSPIRDASGTIIGASKIARDVTERKRAAAEVAAQQEWFRVTLASIGDGVIASTPDGHVTYLNGPAEALTGWSLDEARGRPLVEVFHIANEKTREEVENPAGLVMRSGHVVGLANHTLLISRDGTERPIADSAAPIRDAEGRIIGVILVFRDVTEERRAEEAIAEQREWLETTLRSIGDAVIATDADGRIAFMNAVAERLTGWRAEAAQGQACASVFRIVNQETRAAAESPHVRVLAEGNVVGLANHTLLIAADGTERPIDDSGAPIHNPRGDVVGVVIVFRDVSERRRVEAERQATIIERERLLDAERAARAEAERASRVKDDFVAMVSHELRTPLNAILGWTQLMMRSRDDPSTLDQGFDIVARNTRVQAQLISDLLDMSRIVSGKLRLELQKIELDSVVFDAVETLRQEAESKGIEIHQRFDGRSDAIVGDPSRLQQVIWNLLSNSIKFTPAGGRIEVAVVHSDSRVEVRVTDTGAGIRPHVLPHVFDRFQQADRSITRRFGGLGLGLSIVKHLVELHGGTVDAQSAGEGRGATFTIVLPVTGAALEAEPVFPSAPALDHTGERVSLDGLRILVVEDEPDTREFLLRLLGSHGAQVLAVASAPDALELLASGRPRPELVVSDIGLPDVDGYDLIKRIRQLERGSGTSVPAIALTAYARPEDRARALRAGYQAHLAKPIEPAELVTVIAGFAGLTDPQRKL